MIQIEVNGGNIYYNLSELFLLVQIIFNFLCNTWPKQSNFWPKKHFFYKTYIIFVDYLKKFFSNLGEISSIFNKKILRLADKDCFHSSNYVFWKAHKI